MRVLKYAFGAICFSVISGFTRNSDKKVTNKLK